jgi:hypothetical protein
MIPLGLLVSPNCGDKLNVVIQLTADTNSGISVLLCLLLLLAYP